ncbi:MAG TPA: alpha-glucan family phosphorylase [Flexilinea sp.]|nr:alpha-glucan family phosphorylase [Flexilinea sp.]HOR56124.1 alpha-glucan family phosphorylase [Flexilinea sp.]HOU19751.1 alpha-glucan family phosphorylase [Flexilinea sp.]HPL58257.1 alpha-glucan family phosphorylase [Flexilinea sp.]HQN62560.1 alpha-glucan family phosphorylase [Flexilinea sp.]
MSINIKRVIPIASSLPKRIERLNDLAYNLWWSWNPEAINVFSKIHPVLWDSVSHNPVAFLQQVSRTLLNRVANDKQYLDLYDRVVNNFDSYMGEKETWFVKNYPEVTAGQSIAYFSFEFGLHESIPAYAGGLGILAGDHLKESSDMGIPLEAIGFIYNQGYFVQKITEDGWQETSNFYLDFNKLPMIPILDEKDKPILISVQLPGREIKARIWQIQVGRVPLYLLDTNISENSSFDQQLTAKLYTSDLETRISQEILLGMGGVRVMRALGYNPTVWHMNEGHSAFLSVERCAELVRQGKTFEEAKEIVRKGNVFTTHTPVPAGNDKFPVWLVEKYFSQIWPDLGLTREQFIDLAKEASPYGDQFTMPILALRLSERCNAVSELHGQVSRNMWHFLWPDRKVEEVPITHITNGVHTFSWLSRRMGILFDEYLGTEWRLDPSNPKVWEKVDSIPDAELWAVKRHQKRKLMRFINDKARAQWLTGEVHPVQTIAAGVLLDADALTIGFARRFPTYKRGYLILRDYERLLRIINNVDAPVQIIFSGKAHPADEPGKLIVQQLYRAIKDHRTGGRMVFVENYDMDIARHLVQGVDVWLNTPRRPMEASGTSGMKAAMNGCLNFSVLDGWWHEGYNGKNGWAIGDDKTYESDEKQDEMDALSLYETLEDQIVPIYYSNRSENGVPTTWMRWVKEAIRTLSPQFSTRRMVGDYVREMYIPAIKESEE